MLILRALLQITKKLLVAFYGFALSRSPKACTVDNEMIYIDSLCRLLETIWNGSLASALPHMSKLLRRVSECIHWWAESVGAAGRICRRMKTWSSIMIDTDRYMSVRESLPRACQIDVSAPYRHWWNYYLSQCNMRVQHLVPSDPHPPLHGRNLKTLTLQGPLLKKVNGGHPQSGDLC